MVCAGKREGFIKGQLLYYLLSIMARIHCQMLLFTAITSTSSSTTSNVRVVAYNLHYIAPNNNYYFVRHTCVCIHLHASSISCNNIYTAKYCGCSFLIIIEYPNWYRYVHKCECWIVIFIDCFPVVCVCPYFLVAV